MYLEGVMVVIDDKSAPGAGRVNAWRRSIKKTSDKKSSVQVSLKQEQMAFTETDNRKAITSRNSVCKRASVW